ncbi:MAG: Threonine dehydrogenase Tdh [Candidatus Methanohalarchaeum thermophilum]|uniref:Threonine dehydrogenase Tdh n=1 Tax=Methanohalarchaeum thermophilum TaxID=1903181 RepID=A0A1Q6DVH7_METT1|nr:MAG: Threonine dehydrogenase Tdh [Candidatus Methanohalarchaeum thermophilum]
MKRRSLFFMQPKEVKVKTEEIKKPKDDELLVENLFSLISIGTEMLVYRNDLPKNLELTPQLKSMDQDFNYPIKYGYSSVGKVIEVGTDLSTDLLGEKVIAFNPHETHFKSKISDLVFLPDNISPREAVFLPNMETALNLVLDGRPLIGENVLVIGQGTIGLLTTSILSKLHLSNLITVDKFKLNRVFSQRLGADNSLGPDLDQDLGQEKIFNGLNLSKNKFDLTYEVTGNPKALDLAVDFTGFEGRIVIGSWYGNKKEKVKLGTEFHRNRIKILSSQVSSIRPDISKRWDKDRRINLSLDLIQEIDVKELITDEFRLKEAQRAYNKIENRKKDVVQILFKYGG